MSAALAAASATASTGAMSRCSTAARCPRRRSRGASSWSRSGRRGVRSANAESAAAAAPRRARRARSRVPDVFDRPRAREGARLHGEAQYTFPAAMATPQATSGSGRARGCRALRRRSRRPHRVPGGEEMFPEDVQRSPALPPLTCRSTTMNRREFLNVLAAAAAAGFPLARAPRWRSGRRGVLRRRPVRQRRACCTSPTATRSCCRSTSASRTSTSASATAAGKPPHLVGEALLKHFGIAPGTREAHAFTYLDFARRGAGLRHRWAASRTSPRW